MKEYDICTIHAFGPSLRHLYLSLLTIIYYYIRLNIPDDGDHLGI